MDKKTLELEIKIIAEKAAASITDLSGKVKEFASNASSFSGNTKQTNDSLSRMETAAKNAAQSIKLFGTNTTELKNVQAQIKTTVIDLVNNGLKPEDEAVKGLIAEYKNLKNESDKLDSSQSGLIGSFNEVKNQVSSLATVMAAVKFDKVVTGLVSTMLDTADSFQTARNEWGILLQDMEAGAAVFDTIINPFQVHTPFDLEATQRAATVLKSAKIEINDLTNWLTRMGDLSQGNSQKMLSYTDAFSRASAKGKADMQVLNVFLAQGVPILDELGKHFGKTSAEIVNMVSEGKVSFEDFKQTLETMTESGGQYFGGMELAAQSYKAMQEGLQESVNELAASFGDMLLPHMVKILDVFTNIIDAINDSPFVKGVFAGALAAVAISLNAMAIKATLAFIKQMSLNFAIGALNPAIMAATVAVAAIVAGLTMYTAAQQKTIEASNNLAYANKTTETTADNLKRKYDELTQSLDNYKTKLMDVSYSEVQRSKALAKQNLEMAQSALDEVIKKQKNSKPTSSAEWSGLNPDIANIDVLGQQLQREREKIESEIAQIKRELQMYDDVLEDQNKRKISLVDEIYSDTAAGKIEKLQAKIKQIKNEMGKGGSDEFLQKANYAIQQINKEIEYLQKKEIPLKFTTDWTDKELSGINALNDLRHKAAEKLHDEALKFYGKEYETQSDFLDQLYAMNRYYDQQIADFRTAEAEKLAAKAVEEAQEERNRIREFSQMRKTAYLEESQYRQGKAAQSMKDAETPLEYFSSAGNYAAESFKQAIVDTDLGTLLTGAGDPLTAFISALVTAIAEVESVSQVLNFMQTIASAMVGVIEPILDDIFMPFAEILEEIGIILGQLLAPILGLIATTSKVLVAALKLVLEPLKMLGKVFEWLYNKVIIPVGNGFISAINAIIDALNMIPGVNIKKIKYLSVIGEAAEEAALAMEEAKEKIKTMYNRQIDAVKEELNAQIASIKKQYELGLLTRDEYIAQKDIYQQKADDELLDINKLMAAALAQIELNTYAALNNAQQNQVGSARQSYAQKLSSEWGNSAGVLGEIAGGVVGAVADVGVAIWDGVTTAVSAVGNWVSSWWPFADGTSFMPFSGPIIAHEGEGIIPRTFNDAIRSGEYALVGGKNNQTNNSSPTYISIQVDGSVVTERQLIDVIYDGLSRAIMSGKSPLPGI